MTKTALGFYDPGDEWRRLMKMMRGFQVPQTQLHETLKAIRGPSAQMQEILKGFQTPNAELHKTIRAAMPAAQMQEALKGFRVPRIADQQWREVPEATSMPQRQWQEALKDFRMSDSAVSQLIEAARVPRSDWQRALRHIRDVTNSPLVAGFAEDLEAELETAELVADPDRAGTSWIWTLAFVKQVGLLVVALEILEAWSEWLVVMFSDEELPPELTQTTRLLFLLIGALMIVIQLRSEESSDDD